MTPRPGQPFGPVDYETRTHRVIPSIPPHVIEQAHQADYALNALRQRANDKPSRADIARAVLGGLLFFALVFGLAVVL